MGWRAADGIANGGVDCQVEVRAIRIERISEPTPNSSQPCHQPCSPTTTRGSSFSLNRARARIPPAGVRTSTQSPFLIPRAEAVAGFSSISACNARLRRLGSARCWVWQNRLGFAQVRIKGKEAVRSGRATRADWRFDKIRQGRIAVIEESLRPEFDFPRRRRKAARVSFRRRSPRACGDCVVSGFRNPAGSARSCSRVMPLGPS